ncbi:MAG: RNA polymerase sigma factor [Gemmatimonadota bacterium]
MTERELIERTCAGEAAAARTIYRRHAPRVFAVVRRLCGEDDLARDCSQEAWIRVFRALHDFRGEARLSTWIHRIAVNSTLNTLRRARREDDRRAPLPASLPERTSVPPPSGDPLLRERLEVALDSVPEGMRRILVLHDVEGYTHQEISEMLDITTGTSKSQLFKARSKMRELLGGGRNAPNCARSTHEAEVTR